MSITYLASNKILDKTFGASAFTPPTSYWVGLSTTTLNADGTGATEPVANGYARVQVTNTDKTNWTSAASGALTNATAVTFPESSGSWGTITTVVLYDAQTTGNAYFFDTLTPSRAVAASTTVVFAIGAITISMTNS